MLNCKQQHKNVTLDTKVWRRIFGAKYNPVEEHYRIGTNRELRELYNMYGSEYSTGNKRPTIALGRTRSKTT